MSEKISDKLKEKILQFVDDGDIPAVFVVNITKAFKDAGFTKTDIKKIFFILGWALNGNKIEDETVEVMTPMLSMFTS